LINTTRIHLMPSMNPDGYELVKETPEKDRTWTLGRANANGVDLNRDFPDLDTVYFAFEKAKVPRYDHLLEFFDENQDRQPETKAVGNWILSLPFVLSANLHEGDLVANYPFDMSRVKDVNKYSKTPDDGTFRALALSYSQAHARMAKPDQPSCDKSAEDTFAPKGGITNGARWYSLKGGMQDFNYLATNAFELTMELSCDKFPTADQLEQLWIDNQKSLIEFMWQSHIGIKGLITDAFTDEPIDNAVIWVVNVTDASNEPTPIAHPVTSAVNGDYWRLLTPGKYQVVVHANGYEPDMKEVSVTAKDREEAKRVDFNLLPKDEIINDDTPIEKESEGPTDEELQELMSEMRNNRK